MGTPSLTLVSLSENTSPPRAFWKGTNSGKPQKFAHTFLAPTAEHTWASNSKWRKKWRINGESGEQLSPQNSP